MAAKWQQWMPFHINRFKASAAVQAMHPAARMGYLYLLTCAWESDDCTVSPNAVDLADASGLGDELWSVYGPRILRNFITLESGRLRNLVCFEEWTKARDVFEARQCAAIQTNQIRSPRAKSTVTDGLFDGDRDGDRQDSTESPQRSADTITLTKTRTTTKTKTSSAVDPRRKDFLADLSTHWKDFAKTDFVFEAMDGKQVDNFLRTWPQASREEWRQCLVNRMNSPGSIATQRIYLWLSKLMEYRDSPLNEFGRPINNVGVNGNGNKSQQVVDSISRSIGEFDARYGDKAPNGKVVPSTQQAANGRTIGAVPLGTAKRVDAGTDRSIDRQIPQRK